MSRTKRQHELAIVLLKELKLNNIQLEPAGDGGYRFVAWKEPGPEGNGAGRRILKRGKVAGR